MGSPNVTFNTKLESIGFSENIHRPTHSCYYTLDLNENPILFEPFGEKKSFP